MSKRVSIILPGEISLTTKASTASSASSLKSSFKTSSPDSKSEEIASSIRMAQNFSQSSSSKSHSSAYRRKRRKTPSRGRNSSSATRTTNSTTTVSSKTDTGAFALVSTGDSNSTGTRKTSSKGGSTTSSFKAQLMPTFTLVITDDSTISEPSNIDSKKSSQDLPRQEVSDPPNSPDECQLFQGQCCCCHCVHVRCALKQAEFLKSPEGQHRQEMKLLAKNLFMDICAMAHVRKQVLNELRGTKQKHPSSRTSYPVSLCAARKLDSHALTIEWFVHDHSDIDHYDIFVDNQLTKRVYNAKATSTILVGMNVGMMHNIRMKAEPSKGVGSKAHPIDKLVREVCAGRLDNVMNGDFFCECEKTMATPKAFYKRNCAKSLVDFWKESEFLYMPTCTCQGSCDCDCFMPLCETVQQTNAECA